MDDELGDVPALLPLADEPELLGVVDLPPAEEPELPLGEEAEPLLGDVVDLPPAEEPEPLDEESELLLLLGEELSLGLEDEPPLAGAAQGSALSVLPGSEPVLPEGPEPALPEEPLPLLLGGGLPGWALPGGGLPGWALGWPALGWLPW